MSSKNSRTSRISKVQKTRLSNLSLVLHEIEHRDNIALILRTAEVFGIKDVYIIPHPVSKSKYKSSVAKFADKWLNIEYISEHDLIKKLKENGYQIIATLANKPAVELPNYQPEGKIALFIGNEVKGLPESVIKMANTKLIIPMYGLTQSLNASAATSVFLYDIVTKLNLMKKS